MIRRKNNRVPGGYPLVGAGRRRKALAALEFVMASAVTLLIVVTSTYLGIRICRLFFSLWGTMVGSPYL
jgi:hypothetical protein